MKDYNAKDIFNIVLAGHSSSGKTSLIESMLFVAKQTDRLGKVDDGNTVCDFDAEEIKRHSSIGLAIAPVEWKNKKINFIDTPGLFDFEGALSEGMRVADTALITVSGKAGVCVGTKKAFYAADKKNAAKVFFVNGLCDEEARFYRVFEDLKADFGPAVCPVVVPFIQDGKAECYVNVLEYKAYKYTNNKVTQVPMPDMGDRLEGLRTAINEAVAETSDEMFEKYFSGESFTPEEIILGISKGVKSGKIYPVFCGDAQNTYGIDNLLNGLIWLTPSAYDKGGEIAVDTDGNLAELSPSREAQTAAIVFKTLVDPFVGKLSFFKVVSGVVLPDSMLVNVKSGKDEKIGKLLVATGKNTKEVGRLCAGDIGAVAKLSSVCTGDSLCSPARKVILDGVEYPKSGLSYAVYPETKGDEDKVAQGIMKLSQEDPTILFTNNQETHEMILSTLGEQHTDVVLSRLKSKFAVKAFVKTPKVAYRETIKSSVKAQGRYKKQTGGHGQFGDVWIEFEPSECEGLEFCERIVGGSVPKGYFPAVEKGLLEAMQRGVLAGYPVVGLKATLYDGSYHPVDSSEMAFKTAASLAYKNGLPKANPVLLEPIGELTAIVPDASLGDVMGEINKKRGKILGIDASENSMQKISAEAPISEMHTFATFIRQATQGQGYFSFEFSKYEEVPSAIAGEIIEKAKSSD